MSELMPFLDQLGSFLDLPNLLIGAIIGSFLEIVLGRLLRKIGMSIDERKQQKRWDAAECAMKKYQYLAHGFEVVQYGWRNKQFLEEQVILTVEGNFTLPQTLIERIREPKRAEWEREGKRDLPQYGIREITITRETEAPDEGQSSHAMLIKGHLYTYFDSMSTHFTYLNQWDGYDILLKELNGYLKSQDLEQPYRYRPIRIFPTPLSVGLSLFCENGNYLAVTKRTYESSGGGHIAGGQLFNAVGENVNHEKDNIGEFQDRIQLSPWKTAIRGLEEEIGVDHTRARGARLVLHSLVWDRRILDYKFFGLSINDLSRAEIRSLFEQAHDLYESTGRLFFLPTATTKQCVDLVKRIFKESEQWASEAIYCTLASLLVFDSKKFGPKDLEKTLTQL